MNQKIQSREQAYKWICKMCNVHKEDIHKFIQTVIECDGNLGLNSRELEYLKECDIDILIEKHILTD